MDHAVVQSPDAVHEALVAAGATWLTGRDAAELRRRLLEILVDLG